MNEVGIKKEVDELNRTKSQWSRTMMNKSQVRDLISEINIFNHTFSARFPNSVKHYKRNGFAEIHITDAISDLKHYSKSELKKKDDDYFHRGMKNLRWGLDHIIMELQKDLETD